MTPLPSPLAPLSVVIPVRNEAARLPLLLADLAAAPASLLREVWVVDGGSGDASGALARLGGAHLLQGTGGRGGQLRRGMACCESPWILVLHADVRLPPGWPRLVQQAMAAGRGRVWVFPLAIEAAGPLLHLVAWLSTLRSRLFALPYGDQGLLLSRWLYDLSGGFAPLPLMEDLELVLRLRRLAPIHLLERPLLVDGRRWRRLGVLRTTWRNAALRRAWRRGVSAVTLVDRYDAGRPCPRGRRTGSAGS